MSRLDTSIPVEFHQNSNPEFYSCVRQFSIDEILETRTQTIVDLMMANVFFDIEKNEGDVGIALPQLVIPKPIRVQGSDRDQRALFVAYSFKTNTVSEYFNPEILEESDEQTWDFDACLSVKNRGKFILVPRPKSIEMRWLDRRAEIRTGVFDGMDARINLHEFDHVRPTPVSVEDISGIAASNSYTLEQVYALYTDAETSGADQSKVPVDEAVRQGYAR